MGTHTATGASMQTSGTKNTGSAVSTGPDLMLCDQFCAVTANCFNNCQGMCNSYQDPPCQAQGTALVMCMVQNFDTVTCQVNPNVCDQFIVPFTMCRQATPQVCGEVACAGGSGSFCSCTGECQGGQERAICDIQNGSAVCTCYLNTMPISECSGPVTNPDTICSLKTGCCGSSFGT